MNRDELAQRLHVLLEVPRFRDYCPNGLQVEGSSNVRKIVAGVTACQALINAAIEHEADALIVHHGYFWKGEDSRIIGIRRQRLKTLLSNNINLFAYHLPLDAHPDLGNNAQLAKVFGWQPTGRFGEQDIGWFGDIPSLPTLGDLAQKVTAEFKRPPLTIGDQNKIIRRIAWCSGGGDSYFESAVNLGVDAFFSGEISEPAVHLAREAGVAYIAAGHHATERGGVRALSELITKTWGIHCQFVDIENPA